MTQVISVYNQAVTPLGLDLDALVACMQEYVDKYVGPAWNVQAKLARTDGPVSETVNFVFLDDADVRGALAYHSVDSGLPIAKVFVRTDLKAGSSLSVSATHELVELLCDASCSQTATSPAGVVVALEAADPVEETTFQLQGFDVSDFVLPSYFAADEAFPFDYCKVLTAPFQVASGGYQSVIKDGQWTEVFGSVEKQARFALEDRRGHRSEYRKQKQSNNAMVDAIQRV